MAWTFYNSNGEALTNFGPTVLTDINISGGADIGAVLADADEFAIYDVTATSNKKSSMDRINTYINVAGASGVAKAYGTVEGGTLQSNSLGITDGCLDSTGVYTVAWSFTWANANYAVSLLVQAGANRTCTIDNPDEDEVTVKTYIASSGALDSNNYHIVAFGDK